MAKEEYLEISDLDTRSEADKVSVALIYVTTLFFLVAVVLLLMKLGDYGPWP